MAASSRFSDMELLMDYNLRFSSPHWPKRNVQETTPSCPPQQTETEEEVAAAAAAAAAAAGGGGGGGDQQLDSSSIANSPRHLRIPSSLASLSLSFSPLLAFSSASSSLRPSKLQRAPMPHVTPSIPSATSSSSSSSKALVPPAISSAVGATSSMLAKGVTSAISAAASPEISQLKGKRPSSSLSSSAFPDFLHLHLPEKSRGFGNPTNGAASRRASIVWFRNDLRCHDNESLTTASQESLSILPVYIFDPRHYEKKFDKTMGGANRASFLLQCVSDLREKLKELGSDLIVRVGKTEEVLVNLAKAIGADGLYAHQEVSRNDIEEEKKVTCALENEGVDVKYFWGNTLFHMDDLPFKIKDMPSTYTAFLEKVEKLNIRKAIDAPEQLKGLPVRGNIEPGEMPSLEELGVKSSTTNQKKGMSHVVTPLVGGEKEALRRLSKLATDHARESSKKSNISSANSIYGSNFSSKISPWLAVGCLSPRRMVEELKAKTNSLESESVNGRDVNWLVFELQWRDFFRFITKKYSNSKEDGSEALASVSVS